MWSSIKARKMTVAAAATLAAVATVTSAGTASATSVTPTSACEIPNNYYGHPGAVFCGTSEAVIRLPSPSRPQLVVVGTDYKVYLDDGSGWRPLGNGAVGQVQAPASMGVFLYGSNGVKVRGTTYTYYCITYTGGWNRWFGC